MADVSVIIPAWNAADHIGQAITSALRQGGEVIEVLVIDDASPDATGAVVSQISDPRLRYHRRSQNGGVARARNDGFERARGRFVAVLDADDYYEVGRLRTLLAVAQESRAEIVADNVWITSESAPSERRLFIPEALDGSYETYDLACYALANRMFDAVRPTGYLKPIFQRDFLRAKGLAYDPRLRIGEDYHLVAQALSAGARYVRHRSAGYVYTTREGSISHRLRLHDVEAMRDASAEALRTWGPKRDAADQAALAAHLASLEDAVAFVRLVEDLKAKAFGSALRTGLRRPSALRHLAMPLQARLQRLQTRLGLGGADGVQRRSLG